MAEPFEIQGDYDPQQETVTLSLEDIKKMMDANNEGWAMVNQVRALLGKAPEPKYGGDNFLGFKNLEEHRTVGPVRAWCDLCSTWCYASSPCPDCDLVDAQDIRDIVGDPVE